MAFADTRHEVVGLTIAAGNVGLRHTVANALKLGEVAGREDVPVHAGCEEPLLHPSPDAGHVHGQHGFGDVGYQAAVRKPDARSEEHTSELQSQMRTSYAIICVNKKTNRN